jgi:hypothetical protein
VKLKQLEDIPVPITANLVVSGKPSEDNTGRGKYTHLQFVQAFIEPLSIQNHRIIRKLTAFTLVPWPFPRRGMSRHSLPCCTQY